MSCVTPPRFASQTRVFKLKKSTIFLQLLVVKVCRKLCIYLHLMFNVNRKAPNIGDKRNQINKKYINI